MIYIIEDNIDEKVWMIFEAANDRAAKRIMRQNIIKYQKDVDFDFTLKSFDDLPSLDVLPVVTTSEEIFKADEIEMEQEG